MSINVIKTVWMIDRIGKKTTAKFYTLKKTGTIFWGGYVPTQQPLTITLLAKQLPYR